MSEKEIHVLFGEYVKGVKTECRTQFLSCVKK